MSYDMERLAVEKVVSADIDNLGATGVHTTSWAVHQASTVTRVLALVTTVLVGAATVQFKKRPIFGSATGESVVATLVIPGGTAAGKTVFKDFKSVNLLPGGQLIAEVTSAATSGNAHYGAKLELHEEAAVEVTNMIKSA